MTAFILKPHMQRWYRAALSGGPGSSAAQALKGETDGLALSFTDTFFHSSTGHYGSARVKDTSTPANNYNSHPFGLLTYSKGGTKNLIGPNGSLMASDPGETLPFEWDSDGNLLGVKFEPTRTNLFLNNRAPVTQNITVTAQAYTLSFYGTGSITLSGAHSATLNGTGANDRVELTFTPSAGTLTCTVSGTIDWVQLEAGTWATSPIETGESPVQRDGDVITLDVSKFPYSATEGTLLVEATNLVPQGTPSQFATLGSSVSNKIWIQRTLGSSQIASFNVRDGGANQAGIQLQELSQHETATIAGTWEENYFLASHNGISGLLDEEGTIPAGLTVLIIGADHGGSEQGSYIRRLLYIPRRVEPLELDILTGASGTKALETNGAWNWYANPRGIVVNGQDAAGAVTWNGSVVVITDNGERIDLLPGYHKDDHTNPSLLRRSSDGKIIAHYSGHNTNDYFQRISTNADDLTEWGPQVNLDMFFDNGNGARMYTYPNLIEIEDGLFTFMRARTDAITNFTTFYSVSADDGDTWSQITQLLTGLRPYTLAMKTGANRIDFMCNDGHPNETNNNSTYHFYYDGGTWRDSAGNDLGSPPFTPASDLTKVWDGSSVKSWGWHLGWDDVNSVPVLVFATFPTPASDHRYQYAKWNGASWDVNEICDAGGPLYAAETYYSGGICIDPDDVNTIYCSREDGNGVYQIWRGVTTDGGQTWTMTQLTNEVSDWCIRPNKEAGSNKITFMKGTYTSYTDFDTTIEFLDV